MIEKIPTQPLLVKKIPPMNPRSRCLCIHRVYHHKMGPSGSSKERDSAWRNANVRSQSRRLSLLGHRSWDELGRQRSTSFSIIWVSKATKALSIEKHDPVPLPRSVSANLTAQLVRVQSGSLVARGSKNDTGQMYILMTVPYCR